MTRWAARRPEAGTHTGTTRRLLEWRMLITSLLLALLVLFVSYDSTADGGQ